AHSNDNIANKDASLLRRAFFFEPQHKQTVFLLALEGLACRFGNLCRLSAHTEIAALNRTVFIKCIRDAPCRFGWNGQSRTARQARCVEAKHFAFSVHQWAAGEAGIRSCFGLDVFIQQTPAASACRAADGRDDSPRGLHARITWTAKCEDQLPH